MIGFGMQEKFSIEQTLQRGAGAGIGTYFTSELEAFQSDQRHR